MKRILFAAVLSLIASPLLAQDLHRSAPATAALLPGMGSHHHAISTRNPEAQKFFDQGLTLLFAFNREEAARSFERAAELDPQAAMPYWGIALARGPHINMYLDLDVDNKAAWKAIERALALRPQATEYERACMDALARRFSPNPNADAAQLAVQYRNAMRELAAGYPDDLDAATLYAESIMILRPHGWWGADGTPVEDTTEFLTVLESVLRRDPGHPGANHYYIHAMDSSLHPERALPSAYRLMTLVPGAGHLVHMPAHIFWELGEYELVAQTNERAVQADRDYFRRTTPSDVYSLGYFGHNLHFIAIARAAQGRLADAKRAADELLAHVAPAFERMPEMMDYYMVVPLYVRLRFHRWDEVLQMPAPDLKAKVTTALWHFARASAFAAKGNAQQAQAEQRALEAARRAVPPDTQWVFNRAGDILNVAAAILDARLVSDSRTAIELWRKAVAAQDALHHDEPPAWYYSIRESLGAALLRDGQAAEAEKVFRADLAHNPRNPRSLFGMCQSLLAQNKTSDAGWVKQQFDAAWQHADAPLRLEDL